MYRLITAALFTCIISACSTQDLHHAQSVTVFDEFWTWVDEHYIYFDDKDVSWSAIYERSVEQISDHTTDEELFYIMEAALKELRDGHCTLESEYGKAKSYDFRQGYEIHFSPQLVKSKYVTDSLAQKGHLYSAILSDDIGYIYLPKFNRYSGFRDVLSDMKNRDVKKIIIDVRSNGGGDSNAIPKLLGVFVKEETVLGAYIEKSGPHHTDVTAPLTITAVPDQSLNIDIPVIVLTNRGSYSATSYFAAMIQGLPQVTIMGQVSGGGGGGNLGYQLSNGWLLAVSVSDFLDKQGKSIEPGVVPDVLVNNTAEDLAADIDAMLELAMSY